MYTQCLLDSGSHTRCLVCLLPLLSAGLRINEFVTTVDSEMCKSALGQNLNLVKQLYAVLQGEVKPSGYLLSIRGTG